MKVLSIILNILGVLLIVSSLGVAIVVADSPVGPAPVLVILILGIVVFFGGQELRKKVVK